MNHRTWTVVSAGLLALALGVLGATLPVPLVALGPGPTFNTLASVDGRQVVSVEGLPTYPTSGNLNMTTVSVTDSMTLFSALEYWASSTHQVVPRDTVFPPGQTSEQVQTQNTADFNGSEINAESAATRELNIPSVPAVTAVTPGSAADGILRVGDRILTVSGQKVVDPMAVSASLAATRPGQVIQLGIERDGSQTNVTVSLGVAPQADHGLLGVVLGVLPASGNLAVSLQGIGGPSAGLMFSLGLVDKLTPGSLTGGRFIAGTGQVSPDGTVSKIGGIQFKMAAAKAAGATIFLVPSGDCVEALAAAPQGLRLVKVESLHSAVEELTRIDQGRTPTGC